jgi:hypothetical protein
MTLRNERIKRHFKCWGEFLKDYIHEDNSKQFIDQMIP